MLGLIIGCYFVFILSLFRLYPKMLVFIKFSDLLKKLINSPHTPFNLFNVICLLYCDLEMPSKSFPTLGWRIRKNHTLSSQIS